MERPIGIILIVGMLAILYVGITEIYRDVYCSKHAAECWLEERYK